MSQRQSFVRKIIYMVIICVLLVPLYWIGHPGRVAPGGQTGHEGGVLANLRAEHDLSEAQLGEIDPTGATLQLATFGMRGVATNILWQKANAYKKKKDWTNLAATLNQITKLEPHYLTVWRFQAWNLSYNVSAEFDDYRQRFQWVIRGIKFLQQGIHYNKNEPRLLWDVGWFTAQKIGRADEHEQFRRLYIDPDNVYDIHGSRPIEQRDNWLVGKEWFTEAEELADAGAPLRGMSPVIFYSDRPMCQMNYANALEEDGTFKEKAQRQWRNASDDWHQFGDREITMASGNVIRLNEREKYEAEAGKYRAQLDALEPGLREKIEAEKRAKLSDAEREALDTPLEQRTEEQYTLAYGAAQKIKVDHNEVALRMTGAKRRKALNLAEKLSDAEKEAHDIQSYRQIVNFAYWRRRAQVEQRPEVLAARELIYDGNQAFPGDLVTAKEKFDAGLAKWRELFDQPEFKDLVEDDAFGTDLMDVIIQYRTILEAQEQSMPEDFILQDIIDLHGARAEGW